MDSNENRRIEIVKVPATETKKTREFLDPSRSTRGGLSGLFETTLRKFKNFVHLILIVPIYGLGCIALGLAAAPAVAFFEYINSLAQQAPKILSYLVTGSSLAASFFIFGFSLLAVLPVFNFVLRAKLSPWRGPYYSLEAIRWYIHNGITYLARYTILEFVTPTPFNILFYQMMGMKIGRGTAINTTCISDPSLIEIGEKVTVGGSVTLIGHYGQGGFLVLSRTKIGNGVTIGLKATIMGGVTIGDGAKVVSNSVVLPKTVIPPGETWGGVPAKKIES